MPSKRNFRFNLITLALTFICLYIHESHTTDEPWVDKNGFLVAYPKEPQMNLTECRPCKLNATSTSMPTTDNDRLSQNNEAVVCFGAKESMSSDICESVSNDTVPHIQRLTKFTFKNNITVLSLKKYVMEEWDSIDVTFSNFPSLTHLYLENNHIKSFKSGKSANLTNLQVLSLANNPITHLTSNSFSWLEGSELQFLNLRGCLALTQIDSKVFSSLRNHSLSLDLSHTALTAQQLQNITDAFEDTDIDTGLQALGLSQIGSSEVPINALMQVNHSLKKLSLQGNRLSDWLTNQVYNLSFPELKMLNLKDNDFSRYPTGLFHNMPKLEELILDSNPLTDLVCETLQNLSSLSLKYINTAFSWKNCSLPLLKSINFSNSLVNSSLLNFTFFQKSSLETLILRNSSIGNITQLGILSLQNLKYLDLRNNTELGKNIERISFKGLQKLQFISLRSCAIRAILSANLFESLTELQELDMSFNYITTINKTVFVNLRKLTQLDLRNNHITTLPPEIFRNTDLSKLYLQNNWFTEVSKVMINNLYGLDEVDLSNNPFICQCLTTDFLELFHVEEPKVILLHYEDDSSYECTKRNTQFAIKHLTDFKMENGIYCPESGEMTNNTSSSTDDTDVNETTPESTTEEGPEEDEKDEQHVLKYVLIACSVIFFVLLLSVSCYWKWWNIRLFAYLVKKTVVLSILKDESEIKYKRKTSYQYDAFVSFSDSNRTWILEELIPKLEHQCQIKVCLHERDFQAGLPILENIISCMDRSRCILLVLSHAFLQSHWCQFELNLAQHRLLEMRRDQLLLVLLENIPRNKCSKMLRYLLLTKTYIQWPTGGSVEDQKAFWKKMRKAIGPHLDDANISKV